MGTALHADMADLHMEGRLHGAVTIVPAVLGQYYITWHERNSMHYQIPLPRSYSSESLVQVIIVVPNLAACNKPFCHSAAVRQYSEILLLKQLRVLSLGTGSCREKRFS